MRTRSPLWLTPALLLLLAGCGSSSSTKAASTPSAVATSATPDADATTPDADATTPDADSTASPDADATDKDSDSDSDADAGAATMACGDLTKADPDAAVPSGFPTVTGWSPIGKVTQGSTTAYKGTVTGGPDDLPTVRDAGMAKLEAAGYKEGDHDQEEGAEADGDFTGPHNGNINVRNLCKGQLVVTYTLNS